MKGRPGPTVGVSEVTTACWILWCTTDTADTAACPPRSAELIAATWLIVLLWPVVYQRLRGRLAVDARPHARSRLHRSRLHRSRQPRRRRHWPQARDMPWA